MIAVWIVLGPMFIVVFLFALFNPHIGGGGKCSKCGDEFCFSSEEKSITCSNCGHINIVRWFGRKG